MSRQENLTRQPLPEEMGGNRKASPGGARKSAVAARPIHPVQVTHVEGLRASGALHVGLIAPVCASGFHTDGWVRSPCPVVRTLESTASPGRPIHPQVTAWVLQLEGSKLSVLAVNFLFSTPQQTQYSQVTYLPRQEESALSTDCPSGSTSHQAPCVPNGGSWLLKVEVFT